MVSAIGCVPEWNNSRGGGGGLAGMLKVEREAPVSAGKVDIQVRVTAAVW